MAGMDEQYKSCDDEFHIDNDTSDKPTLVSSSIIANLELSATKPIYQLGNGGETFMCDVCHAAFDSKMAITSHKQEQHVYQCDQCMHNSSSLGEHLAHGNISRSSVSSSTIAEKTHLMVDNTFSTRFFHCKTCTRPYQDAISLNEHTKRIHRYRVKRSFFPNVPCITQLVTHDTKSKNVYLSVYIVRNNGI